MTQLILQLKEIVPEYNPSMHPLRHALIRKESATQKKSAGAGSSGQTSAVISIVAAHVAGKKQEQQGSCSLRAQRIWRRRLRHSSYAPFREVRFVLLLYYQS